nr:uncharacterized protein LOC109167528 [Ipomoea batatas]
MEHATVSGLLDHSGTWDEDVVKDLFVATDVPSILATPVSPTSRYVWLWQGDVREGRCPFCHSDEETIYHLFCSCPATTQGKVLRFSIAIAWQCCLIRLCAIRA